LASRLGVKPAVGIGRARMRLILTFLPVEVRSIAVVAAVLGAKALRRILNPMGTIDGIEFLLGKLRETPKGNATFFESMNT
jgi:hypothetical protein